MPAGGGSCAGNGMMYKNVQSSESSFFIRHLEDMLVHSALK